MSGTRKPGQLWKQATTPIVLKPTLLSPPLLFSLLLSFHILFIFLPPQGPLFVSISIKATSKCWYNAAFDFKEIFFSFQFTNYMGDFTPCLPGFKYSIYTGALWCQTVTRIAEAKCICLFVNSAGAAHCLVLPHFLLPVPVSLFLGASSVC